ncbi:dimethyl sulfoxide reductase DmsA precursor [bacterium BMS3Abin03]|nr:dimethyl sulfoxide reductase DmsA precursor [bacterium BMS3Abin03]
MEIKRRDFLKLLSGASGAVALGTYGCSDIIDVPEKLIELAQKGPGIVTWTNTICGQCSAGCGIKIRRIDGIPVYIKGNPTYPVNRGGMCPSGHSSLEVLFNPDRVKEPLKRIGLKESGKWDSISWNDALQLIADKMIELRNVGKPHQVAFLDGSDQPGLMNKHIAQFMKAYGSPNYYQSGQLKNNTAPYRLLQGINQLPSYDLLNSKYILSFGSNFLEEGYSPIYYTKIYSHLRDSSEHGRTRIVQIDSRISLTAANADLWIPIRPGTYGALALGIAFVLIREKLFDDNFIKNYSFGFNDWTDNKGITHLGFRSNVISNYYPEQVSKITGVPAETILKIARDLGNSRSSVVLGDQGTVDNTNGTFSQMAVHSLNALLGNFGKDGGVYFVDLPPLADLPPFDEDEIAALGNSKKPVAQSLDTNYPLADFSIDSFTKNILNDDPYPIDILFLYKGNPLFKTLNHHDFAETLKKIPLVVSFDPFITETSEYADIILPDHTFLEKWDKFCNTPTVGFTHVGIQQPVIEPLFSTRNAADVIIELSNKIDQSVANALPFQSYENEIRFSVEKLYNSGEGAIISEGVKSSWLEYLQQRGWQIGRYNSFDEFWKLLTRNGGWWNPIRQTKDYKELFKTPSGKFEFYSQNFANIINKLIETTGGESPENREKVLHSLNISVRGDKVFLPHYEAVPIEENMPLYFITFKLLTNRDGQSSNQPMMQEMFGYTVREYWNSWVEINPETAQEYGIEDKKDVWIESPIGSIKVRARLNPGIMKEVVAVPFGLGHTSYGRYAKGYGTNPITILKNKYDMINGNPALQATKVKISLAT